MNCKECGALMAQPKGISVIACARCGCRHFAESGNKFYPSLSMNPVTTSGGILSMWMDAKYRPVVSGMYELRFRHTEPRVIPLLWNGLRFVCAITGQRVDMSQLLAWRGMLA